MSIKKNLFKIMKLIKNNKKIIKMCLKELLMIKFDFFQKKAKIKTKSYLMPNSFSNKKKKILNKKKTLKNFQKSILKKKMMHPKILVKDMQKYFKKSIKLIKIAKRK